jgi:hypothetical protein
MVIIKELELILKCICLFILSISIYFAALSVNNRLLFIRQTNLDPNGVYIWGDSRVYRGIDVVLLKQATNRNVFNYSKHGSGPYDFLVFTYNVPRNSNIILGLSEAMFLRDSTMDLDTNGLVISELLKLFRNGYDAKSIIRIIKRNLKSSNNYVKIPEPYPFDTKIKSDEWDLFMSIYNSRDRLDLLDRKIKLFKEGLMTLKNKNCNVKLVVMPISEKLKIEFKKSVYSSEISRNYKVITENGFNVYSSVNLSANKNIMYDHSHLNIVGRKLMTDYVVNKMF